MIRNISESFFVVFHLQLQLPVLLGGLVDVFTNHHRVYMSSKENEITTAKTDKKQLNKTLLFLFFYFTFDFGAISLPFCEKKRSST